jgi:hypothetical protein
MGVAAAAAEAEADSGVDLGWLALVVITGGVVGAFLASEVGFRRGGGRYSSSGGSSGTRFGSSAQRIPFARLLGGSSGGTSGGSSGAA